MAGDISTRTATSLEPYCAVPPSMAGTIINHAIINSQSLVSHNSDPISEVNP
jgi:hypothetical protein